MRKKIVAGNWKMNLLLDEAKTLHHAVTSNVKENQYGCEVYHFVPSLYITSLLNETNAVAVGAQNGHPSKNGAFTGEISLHQLKKTGVSSVLIGHSERRQQFHESNAFLKEKVNAALAEKMKIFFCCGESLEQRESGDYVRVVIEQLNQSLFHLSSEEMKNVVIAYEPIWAIGTGKTATPEQANEMHIQIRKAVASTYSDEIAENTNILYGGSCNPSNAVELFSQSDIDGGLIGGASLKAEDFISILKAAQ
ncbi:MAG TPA: triose-phosphate isomerase [Brumimicrobium sp.]|nr:triose-phosphate isomerase [Brumimicrobium sp.]